MTKLTRFLHKHKVGLKLLSFLMCFVMVFCFCGIQESITAKAVAGVDDIIVFVIALMIACGVSFTSAEIAESTAERFYSSADSEVKSIIEEAYATYEADFLQDATIANGLIMCLASEWDQIFDAISAFIWPQSVVAASSYVDFSTDMSAYDSFVSMLQAEGTLSFDYQVTLDSYTSFSCGNLAIELIGKDIAASCSVPSDVIDAYANSSENVIMKVSVLGTQYCFYQILFGSTSYMNNYITYYDCNFSFTLDSDNVLSYFYSSYSTSTYPLISANFANKFISGFMYYGNERVIATPTYDGTSYSLLSASIGTLIGADGLLYGSDYLIPCDADRITDDYLTKAFTCDPTISIGNDYIGNDTTWQDSIADVGSGSIAFPLEVDDLISLSPADVRDKTLTQTGDIADTTTSDTTTGDTSSDKTKPKFPTAPELSLPEILFKEKFPFCLPWDLYNVFANLVAEPEAPVFKFPFVFERLGIDYEFTIDLSQFDDLARVSRFFSSVSFVIFLILQSRKMVGAE